MHYRINRLGCYCALVAVALLAGCAAAPKQMSIDELQAIIAAPDRSEADVATDKRRDPIKLLRFYGIAPGMRVLDISAGAGYNTELLARAVAPVGVVYAQNTRGMLDSMIKDRFSQRMKSPAMKNVVPVVREFEDPVPPEALPFDLVTFNFNYHDLGWLEVDRSKLNRAVFRALRPGGVYIIADHSGRPGTGISESKTLHRVEEALVRRDVEAAGFRFVEEGGFLRNPADPRDKAVFMPAQPNDEFVLKFVKP